MERCFEKHRVNLDPSSGRSETSIVYRPIDKYVGVLPHLIGSDKWNEKWHVGLLDVEADVVSHAGSEPYAESVDSNIEPTDSLKPYMDESIIPGGSGLLSSRDSLAKSIGSLNEHLVINNAGGLFDDIEYEQAPVAKTNVANNPTASIFRPQPEQRKIVNLFDDEPPSLESSPSSQRKPVNLFDDYGSVDSLPLPSSSANVVKQQPVDLFNDNEFDDFIKKIENEQSENIVQNTAPGPEAKSTGSKIQNDMRKISEEIKTVQLRKAEPRSQAVPEPIKKVNAVVKPSSPSVVKIAPEAKKIIPEVKKVEKEIVKSEPEAKPRLKKITNLFDDDDDDQDDFFTEIMKQKTATKAAEPVAPKVIPVKAKVSSLFDDESDEDDTFDDILSKKSSFNASSSKANDNSKADKKSSSLFADDDSPPLVGIKSKSEVVTAKSSNLFSEKDDSDLFEKKPEVPKSVAETPQTFKAAEKTQEVPAFNQPPPEVPSSSDTPLEVPSSSDTPPEVPSFSDTPPEEAIKDQSVMGARHSQSYDVSQFELPPEESKKNDRISINSTGASKGAKDQQPHASTPTKSLNSSLPFLSDEPPEDDIMWDAEDHYDDHEPKPVSRNVFSPNTSSYSTVPLFDDDIPPDDDFPSTKPPIPEPNFDSEDEFEQPFFTPQSSVTKDTSEVSNAEVKREKSVDQSDHSPSIGSIRSKMDIFTTKVSDDKPSTKKPLPGKLNTNIKINIGALMPGARPPMLAKRDSEQTSSPEESVSEPSNVSSGSSASSRTSNVDPNNNSNLLNNELAKSRARVQVRRRPSTRRGRQASYQKALSAHIEIESDEEEKKETPSRHTIVPSTKAVAPKAPSKNLFVDKKNLKKEVVNQKKTSVVEKAKVKSSDEKKPNHGSLTKAVKVEAPAEKKVVQVAPTKNLSTSIFDDMDDDEEIETVVKKPSLNNDKQPITTSSHADKIDVQIEPSTSRSPIFDAIDECEEIPIDNEASIIEKNSAKSSFYDEEPPPLAAVPKFDSTDIQVPPTKNLSTSIFDDMDDDDDDFDIRKNETAAVQTRVTSSIFDDQPPPLEAPAKVVTTSKISVFYDDEDDTRKMMEDQKKIEEEQKLNAKTNSVAVLPDVVENDVESPRVASSANRKLVFNDEESDDDLFGSKKSIQKNAVAPSKAPVKLVAKQQNQAKSLFDETDDDDLFAKKPAKVVNKSSKLFESDDDMEPSGSIIFAKSKTAQPKKQSLFGDDESDGDDDDLFSSKPKCKYNQSSNKLFYNFKSYHFSAICQTSFISIKIYNH